MRVLIINYEFPPLGGGGGRASAHMAEEMAKLGHQVLVVTSSFRNLPRHEIKDGYEVRRIWSLRKYEEKCRVFEMITFMISSLFAVFKISGEWKPDILIPFFTIPSAPSAWLVSKIKKIPYIVSLRGGDVPGFMHADLHWFHLVTRPVIKKIWHDAKAVVANSQGLKSLALKTAPELPIDVVSNGVDLEYYSKVSEKKDGKDKEVIILTVGRLSSQKGLSILLRAFKLLKEKSQNSVRLMIAGDGPLRSELEALAHTLDVKERVTFCGWCSCEEVLKLYSQANIFTLSSLDEGMPNVLLEAMAMGLPLVATNIAGSCELVAEGKNGFLVPPGEVDLLAEKLGKLVQDEALRLEMGKTSQILIKQYNWQKVAADYLHLA